MWFVAMKSMICDHHSILWCWLILVCQWFLKCFIHFHSALQRTQCFFCPCCCSRGKIARGMLPKSCQWCQCVHHLPQWLRDCVMVSEAQDSWVDQLDVEADHSFNSFRLWSLSFQRWGHQKIGICSNGSFWWNQYSMWKLFASIL